MRLVSAILFGSLINASAATNYVRQGASGSGADWSNAYGALPATLVRGDVYYIADGDYSAYTCNTANSGTTPITIRKATESNHGTSTGWSSTYGDGQAVFAGITINSASSDYWVFDGQVGDWKTGVPYGFKVGNTTVGGQKFFIQSGGVGSVIQYVEVFGPGGAADFAHTVESQGITGWSGSNVTVSHCWVHGVSTAINPQNGWVVEHCVISDIRAEADAEQAHENLVYVSGCSDVTFRYNFCTNWNNEGVFFTWAFGSPSNIKIYGNVFVTEGTRYTRAIEWRSEGSYTNIHVFNNTVAGTGFGGILNNAVSTLNCSATNNLCVGSGCTFGDLGVASNVDDSTTSRFVAYRSDLRLSSALAGTALPSPYNTDLLGTTRGGDGVFDIGAYEYESGAPDTTPPTITARSVPSAGTTIALTFSESVTVTGSSGFAALVNGSPMTITGVSGSGTSYTLTLAGTIYSGQTVTLSYTTSTDDIQDTAGNDLASFTGASVTNGSTQTETPPPASSGTVTIGTLEVGTLILGN